MEKQQFAQITDNVIKNFEGGYWHPNMIKDGRVKDSEMYHYKAGVRKESGETMFGLDRVNGAELFNNEVGRKFWGLIDNAGASKSLSDGGWKWNYKGGSLEPELRRLAGEIMYPRYEMYSKRYLTPEAKKLVDSDPRIVMNFSYAMWNGEGFFQNMAKDVNDAVKKGVTNLDDLAKVSIDYRANHSNSLIQKYGEKMATLMQSMKSFAVENKKTVGIGAVVVWLIIGIVVFIVVKKVNK